METRSVKRRAHDDYPLSAVASCPRRVASGYQRPSPEHDLNPKSSVHVIYFRDMLVTHVPYELELTEPTRGTRGVGIPQH